MLRSKSLAIELKITKGSSTSFPPTNCCGLKQRCWDTKQDLEQWIRNDKTEETLLLEPIVIIANQTFCFNFRLLDVWCNHCSFSKEQFQYMIDMVQYNTMSYIPMTWYEEVSSKNIFAEDLLLNCIFWTFLSHHSSLGHDVAELAAVVLVHGSIFLVVRVLASYVGTSRTTGALECKSYYAGRSDCVHLGTVVQRYGQG